MLLLDEEEYDTVRGNNQNSKVRRLEVQETHEELSFSSLSHERRAEAGSDTLVSPKLPVGTSKFSSPLSFRAKGGNGLAKMDLLRYGAVQIHPSQPFSQTIVPKITSPLLNTSSFTSSPSLENLSASNIPSSTVSLSTNVEPCATSTAFLSSSVSGARQKMPELISERTRTAPSIEANPFASFLSGSRSFSDEASLENVSQKRNSSGSDVSVSPSISSPLSQEISCAAKRSAQRPSVLKSSSVNSSPPVLRQSKISDFFFVKQ